MILFEKGDEILYFNKLHTPFFDEFFRRTSQLVEWPVFLLITIITLRFSYGKGLILAINTFFVFAIMGIFKYAIFANQMRPAAFFEGKVHLNFVQNMEILRTHSFPSGHTAMAFSMFFMLSLLTNNKKWSVLFFIIPLLVAVSRVYLMEHFFRDVYAGSLTGVLIAAAFYLTFVRSGFYNNLVWKDKTLLRW